MSTIFVVGSLNADLVVRVGRLPAAGETVTASDLQRFTGGKGANQAVAAAKLGGRVRMIGRVGDDAEGAALRSALISTGIDVRHLATTADAPTGIALIAVQDDGQNQIVVSAGANAHLSAADVEAGLADACPGDVLLLQLESPLDVVQAAATRARVRGAMVILDPAPAQVLPPDLLGSVDVITPNETEALRLLSQAGHELPDAQVEETALAVQRLGVPVVILKLGPRGAAVVDGAAVRRFPAPVVRAVDTTAAGDAFNGALAVALAGRETLDASIAFAIRAAALSVTKRGAQASMPTTAELGFSGA